MMHEIEVDELFEFLQRGAEPFEDSPNSVIRRLLFLEDREDFPEKHERGSLYPLVAAGLLAIGDTVIHSRRDGVIYRGIITADGCIKVGDETHTTPSSALKTRLA